jgi:hypothetical protein
MSGIGFLVIREGEAAVSVDPADVPSDQIATLVA